VRHSSFDIGARADCRVPFDDPTEDGCRLDLWLDRGRDSLVASFINGVVKDIAAVRAVITLPWSNGQTAGQIAKLKLVKRQKVARIPDRARSCCKH
jgi:transposase